MTKVRKGLIATGMVLVGLQIVANSITDIVLGLAIVALFMAEQWISDTFK